MCNWVPDKRRSIPSDDGYKVIFASWNGFGTDLELRSIQIQQLSDHDQPVLFDPMTIRRAARLCKVVFLNSVAFNSHSV